MICTITTSSSIGICHMSGVDPGFSEGGRLTVMRGCGKGEGAMEAFAMCAYVCS